MNKLLTAILAALFAANIAYAQAPATPATPAKPAAAATASDCEAKAVSKEGKPLAGAAKNAFMKKCEREAKGGGDAAAACEAKAVGKNGKPLAGAAKTAFMKKCEADAAK
ncbi:MAG: hypothetical protein H6R10_2313 [Rhodocyclaceae bacterium]|nr:hypothetical protein [Rhodocyclaceae bacterium]